MSKILEILVIESFPDDRNAISIEGYAVNINRERGLCETKYFNKVEHIANWYEKRGENAEIFLQLSYDDYKTFWDKMALPDKSLKS